VAVGVFVGITPTIPFHTVLAFILALFLRGSKPAAVIGAWVANPLTIPLFYAGSYKAGSFLFLRSVSERTDVRSIVILLQQPLPFLDKVSGVNEFFFNNVDVAWKILAGGVILGIIPAVLSYAITLKFCSTYLPTKEKKEIDI